MKILLGFGLMTTCGYLVSLILAPKLKVIVRLGIGYILGLSIVTLVMFFLPVFGFTFSVFSVSLPLVVLTIALFSVVGFTREWSISRVDLSSQIERLKSKVSRLTYLELLIIISIIILFFLSLILAVYWPIHHYDALWIFDFSAKVFFDSRTVVAEIWQLPRLTHRPLLEPLAHVWLYLLGGSQPHIIYWIYFIAIMLIFYGLLRDEQEKLTALTATLILGSTPLIFYHSTIALSNLPAISYFVPAVIFLDRWFSRKNKGDLHIGAVLFAMTFWARQSSDPYLLAGIMVLTLKSLKQRNIYALAVIAFSIIIINLPWNVVKSINLREVSFYFDEMEFFLIPSFSRFGNVLWTMATELWKWDTYYGFVGLLLLISIAIQPSRLRTHSTIPAIIGLTAVTAIGVLYVIHGDKEPVQFFHHVLDDITVPLIPLVIYWSVPSIMETLPEVKCDSQAHEATRY